MGEIRLKNITVTYEEKNNNYTAVEDVDICIKEGEFLSIIGPSGCGKSTLLSILAGLNSPSEGCVLYDGQEVQGMEIDSGVVFQNYSLFPWMSAKKNITFGIKQVAKDKGKKEIEKIADHYLELVGLSKFASKYPSQLSGGMKQRVAIARTFARNPKVFLMDEPFAAVDAKNRVILQDLLLKLWDSGDKKKTVVLVTHDIDEAILLSDRIIVMTAGPGTVKTEISVDFERPRDRAKLIRTKEYINLRNKLVSLFHDDLLQKVSGDEAAL